MKTFVASDLHFSHRNILQYCPHRRLGKDMPTDEDEVNTMVTTMNELIVRNWNSLIRPNDEVWILGDVCMGQMIHAPKWIRQLNGKKHLVKGNHDKTLAKLPEFDDMFASVQNYKELGFRYKDKKHMICMSHFPMASWNFMNQGGLMLHGHLHGSHCAVTGRIKDVGIDTNNLYPYLLDTVVEELLKIDVIRHHHD